MVALKLLLVLVLLCAWPAQSAGKLIIYAVNYPLYYFTQRIGGDQVEVHLPVPADLDPAFWMPDLETIAAYQGADLIILNGAGYAKWVYRVSLPRLRLVNTSASFSDRLITDRDGISHRHGTGQAHAHAGTAFTIWLDFDLAVAQARRILAALQSKRPGSADYFNNNFQLLEKDLRALDRRLLALGETAIGKPLLASHPVYQYLARRYRLDLVAVTWEPDTMPAEDQWRQLTQALRKRPVNWMIWERQPLDSISRRLLDLGVSVVVFEPVMNRPGRGDFLSLMRHNLSNLEQVLGRVHQ